MAAPLIFAVGKAAINKHLLARAAQFPNTPKTLRAQAGEHVRKGEVHQARVVAVRAEDDAAAQIAPGAQDVPRGVRLVGRADVCRTPLFRRKELTLRPRP